MVRSTVIVLLLCLSAAQSLTNHLKGKHLRIGYGKAVRTNATEAEMRNATFSQDDLNLAFIKWASQRNKFTIEFVVLDRTEPSRQIVRHFKTQNIDCIIGHYGLSRGRNADILFPHDYDTLFALIPTPKRESNVWSFALPYNSTVWLCFFLSMAVLITLLKVFTSVVLSEQNESSESFITWASSINYVLGVATNQGGSCSSKFHSVRLVAALWCLAALVMVNAYSGSLITYMTLPNMTPLLKSIEDLPSRPDLNILSHTTSYAGGVIKNSTLYKPVIGNYLKFPPNFCGAVYAELAKCFFLVKKGGYVFVAMGSETAGWLKRDYAATRTCDMTRTAEGSETFYATYLIPLGSPHEFRNNLDISIMEAASYGLFQKWHNLFATKGTYCQSTRTVDRSLTKLTLVDYSSAFVILAIGVTASTAVFIAERFVLKLSKS